MNYSELIEKEEFKNESRGHLLTFKKGQHYSAFLGKVIFMPTIKNQAKNQITALKNYYGGNLLMSGEWIPIEEFLNKHGFKGDYKITKSKTMCRLLNIDDLINAYKKEFDL